MYEPQLRSYDCFDTNPVRHCLSFALNDICIFTLRHTIIVVDLANVIAIIIMPQKLKVWSGIWRYSSVNIVESLSFTEPLHPPSSCIIDCFVRLIRKHDGIAWIPCSFKTLHPVSLTSGYLTKQNNASLNIRKQEWQLLKILFESNYNALYHIVCTELHCRIAKSAMLQ